MFENNFQLLDYFYSIYPCPAETLRGSKYFVVFLILVLPFVLLRQKGEVFFYLNRDCIFNRSSDFCPRMAKVRVC